MAHRARSKTESSADPKKAKGTPRRLTEKIAIMKRREHEQSEAFEQAMKSIFEMQHARIHGGGGSMPSLQAIDPTVPPTIDMQSVYKDLNEVKRAGSFKERPHSGGPAAGRRIGFGGTQKANSCDTDPYPTTLGLTHPEHYWNTNAEWIDGDLARHKSDSDLQQSLMGQQGPQFTIGSPHHSRNRLNAPPGDLGLWTNKKARPSSMSAALLSPDQYSNQDCLPVPLANAGGTSSLPDLTNIEFSCGLDVPLEQDDEQPSTSNLGTYHSPPNRGPGPSQLVYNSFQASHSMGGYLPGGGGLIFSPPQYRPNASHGYSNPVSSGYHPGGMGPPVSLHGHQLPMPGPLSAEGVRRSPTMPEFRSLQFGHPRHPQITNPTPQFKPILPLTFGNLGHPSPYHPTSGSIPTFLPQLPPTSQMSPNTPPPMTIIIQPPGTTASSSTVVNSVMSTNHQHQSQALGAFQGHQGNSPSLHQQLPSSTFTQMQQPQQHNQHHQQQQQCQQQQHQQQQQLQQQQQIISSQFTNHSQSQSHQLQGSSWSNGTTDPRPPPESPLALGHSPPKPMITGGASLPNTPSITIGHALPSYYEAKQQQALQQRFAAISMVRSEIPMFRSHSEEDLQKTQKERGDLYLHNPFMGNLANANSVPCVYVESPNENLIDRNDSPTPGDSPSTSASYASSPPSVTRPFWVDHPPAINEFVFNEWPVEGGGGGDKHKPGSSPPIHHKSLTDLSTIPEVAELSPSVRGRSSLVHQLSLPSVVMGDLPMDEGVEKQASPTFIPQDFEMDEGLDSLLKHEVSDLHAFDVNMLGSDALLSSSPESYLHHRLNF